MCCGDSYVLQMPQSASFAGRRAMLRFMIFPPFEIFLTVCGASPLRICMMTHRARIVKNDVPLVLTLRSFTRAA